MNKEQILAAFAPQVVEEPVKALGGATVRFRELSGAARDALYDSAKSGGGNSGFEATLIAATVVDENDTPMFSEDDVTAMRSGRAPLLEELSQIAMRLNALGQRAQEEASKN
ncbi:hypothetical protein AWB80_03571 [Caballeronia pedi]|uniref:Phage tail protein n=1 Tax=Caballeronia pedi TaxID=1777141 RepID=A0A158BHD1_9BURK|nr:hypothetical protein [Caballeronia pedi]SAK69484.1 hypothetical protein AWB80_03571 [Caballeronia pedi]